MLSEERSGEISTGVVGPKEDEDAQRNQVIVVDHIADAAECQHVESGERQGNIHLREHSVRPIIDGIGRLGVEFGDEHIHYGEQIGNEYCRGYDARAVASHAEEEVDGCNGGEEAVDAYVLNVVDNARKLPYGQSGHQGKEEYHRLRPQETRHHSRYKEDACDGSCYKIFHFVAHNGYAF